MRLAISVFLVSTLLLALPVSAQDSSRVSEIAQNITNNDERFAQNQVQLQAHKDELALLETQLERMQQELQALQSKQAKAKEAMDEGYKAFLNNPTIALEPLQKDYQAATLALGQKNADISAQQQAIKGQQGHIANMNAAIADNRQQKLALQDRLDKARVERLRTEFSRKGTLEVVHTVNCSRDETLGNCERRGQQQGLEKATSRFLDQLFNNLSEYRLVSAKRALADAKVEVVSSHVIDSEFSGQGNFNVNLSVAMQGALPASQLCTLLEVDGDYCQNTRLVRDFDKQSQQGLSQGRDNDAVEIGRLQRPTEINTDDGKTFALTIRSNVADDQVVINGKEYGSTKLNVELPKGEYQVKVSKPGYKPYEVKVVLEKQQIVYAQLTQQQVTLASK